MSFVERRVEDGHQVVVLRYAALFYWLQWPVLGVMTVWWVWSLPFAVLVFVGGWTLLVATGAPYWSTTFELRQRVRQGSVTVSGSKYSFANPITYRWNTSPKTPI